MDQTRNLGTGAGALPPPLPHQGARQGYGWIWISGGLFLLQLFILLLNVEAMDKAAAPSGSGHAIAKTTTVSLEDIPILLIVGFFGSLPALGGAFIAAYWGKGPLRVILSLFGIALWFLQSAWPYLR